MIEVLIDLIITNRYITYLIAALSLLCPVPAAYITADFTEGMPFWPF